MISRSFVIFVWIVGVNYYLNNMGRKCVIKTCTNSVTMRDRGLIKDVIFHNFPTNETRRNHWIVKIQVMVNQFTSIHHRAVICSDHFEKSSYVTKPDGSKVLGPTAEPTIFGTVDQSFSDVEILSTQCETDRNFFKIEKCDTIILESKSEPVSIIEERDNTTSVYQNDSSSQPQIPLHLTFKPTRVRYPGDIHEVENMSRRQLERSVFLCKKKVKEQATIIASLTRKLRSKESQNLKLRTLVDNLKTKSPPGHAANTVVKEVNKNFLCTVTTGKILIKKDCPQRKCDNTANEILGL